VTLRIPVHRPRATGPDHVFGETDGDNIAEILNAVRANAVPVRPLGQPSTAARRSPALTPWTTALLTEPSSMPVKPPRHRLPV